MGWEFWVIQNPIHHLKTELLKDYINENKKISIYNMIFNYKCKKKQTKAKEKILLSFDINQHGRKNT